VRLVVIAASIMHQTSFTRFITAPGRTESADLKSYLTSLVEHVTPTIDPGHKRASEFYQGSDLGWYAIRQNSTFVEVS